MKELDKNKKKVEAKYRHHKTMNKLEGKDPISYLDLVATCFSISKELKKMSIKQAVSDECAHWIYRLL